MTPYIRWEFVKNVRDPISLKGLESVRTTGQSTHTIHLAILLPLPQGIVQLTDLVVPLEQLMSVDRTGVDYAEHFL